MKTYCKPADVNIDSLEFISPAVHLCFAGKLGKRSFQRLLVSTGKITREQLREDRESCDMTRINDAIDAVAEQMLQRIHTRALQLPPVRQFSRQDGNSGKIRNLCQESPEQQIMEYIVKCSLDPLFQAKILPCQCGSIPGRGQMGAMRKIQRLIRKKYREPLVTAQCDIRKAYPSTSVDTVMRLLRRDIGKNKPLLWLTEAVMANYPGGNLLIGGYLSCWLFNYVMSYVLRFLLDQAKYRRGKRLPMVWGVVNYADDFLAIGALSNLVRAIKKTTRWAKETLGLEIKAAWKIQYLPSFAGERIQRAGRRQGSRQRTPGIDMVGFVVRRTYTIVRGRIFVRFRRQFLRASRDMATLGYVPWWRAQKIVAAWGWIKYSNSRVFCKKYNVYEIVKASKNSVSWHARKVGIYGNLCA